MMISSGESYRVLCIFNFSASEIYGERNSDKTTTTAKQNKKPLHTGIKIVIRTISLSGPNKTH